MESKERFLINRILEDMSDGVIVINFDGEIILCNRAAARILRMPDGALLNKTVAGLMSQSDKNDELFELVLNAVYTKNKITKTIPYFHGDKMLYLRITTDYLTNGGEKVGIILQISDITEPTMLFIANKELASQISNLMRSFVEVMVTAIEEKSPYNANHTKNMVGYAKRYLEWLGAQGAQAEGADADSAPFLMSVWLHDIGKLLVPSEIMDKPTRLGKAEKDILHRIETTRLMLRLKAATEPDSAEERREEEEKLDQAEELILYANKAGFLPDDTIERLKEAARIECMTAEGETVSLLSADELEAITVVRGTLTSSERKVIESHVSLTSKLLSKMEFGGEYSSVPLWAGSHHELLDGSGYPQHLSSEDIPWETRLLTIIDVYDALTAEDRPYKPPMAPEKAFAILRDMAEKGKIDPDVLTSFIESKAWEKNGAETEKGEK